MGKFLKELQRGKIWVVVVPAGLAWLLQPCDTHLFAKYKTFLRNRQYSRLLHTDIPADVTAAHALEDIIVGIRRVIQKTAWASAFDANGFGENQRNVRARIKKELDCDIVPDLPGSLPKLPELESIFPRGRTPDISLLFNGVRAQTRRQPEAEPVAATSPSSPEADVPFVSPWLGRLRSSSRASLEGTLAQESLPPLPPPAPPPPPCPPARPPASAPGVDLRRLPVGRPLPRPRPMQRPATPPSAP